MNAQNVLILTSFIFAGTNVAVTKYPAYICSTGHQFYKNVLSLPDENTQCLVLLYYWKKSVLFSGTEGNEIFYTKPVYYDELFMP
jgi:hypothetical protein